MKKLAYVLIVSLFLSSCQNVERRDKPENLIPEDKMVEVLTDMAILQSARNFNRRLLETTGLDPDSYVYEKHNIDSLQFERSNDYYAENYNRYEGIYERVKDTLERLKARYEEIREEEERVLDSIRRAGEVLDSVNVDSLGLKNQRFRKPSDSIVIPPPSRERN